MKTVVLIKQHPVIQLGHLYEHLFLRRVNAFFYEHGLFKLLDYAAHGTTYEEGGVITVECNLYSSEAIALGSEIEQLRIDLGKENCNVSTALHQIVAEEPNKLYVGDKVKLLQEIKRLDNEPWQSIDNLGILDTKTIRRKNTLIYLTDKKQARPQMMRLSIRLNKDFADTHRELLPLFMFVGRIILLAAGNQVAAAHGAYAGKLYGKNQLSLISELSITKQTPTLTSIEKARETIQEMLRHMLNDATYARIVANLSSMNYETTPCEALNLNELLTETNVLIGTIGWLSIATSDNIKNLLKQATLEVKLGHESTIWPALS